MYGSNAIRYCCYLKQPANLGSMKPLPGKEFTPRKIYLLSYSAVSETLTFSSSLGARTFSAEQLIEQDRNAANAMRLFARFRGRTFQVNPISFKSGKRFILSVARS